VLGQLLAANGIYAEMFRLQAAGYRVPTRPVTTETSH
jgi:hypothetical protein